MRAIGLAMLRISPQSQYMTEVIEAFDAARSGQPAAARAEWSPDGFCNGYWHGRPGIELQEVPA